MFGERQAGAAVALAIRIAASEGRQLVLLDMSRGRDGPAWAQSVLREARRRDVETRMERAGPQEPRRAIVTAAVDLEAALIITARAGLNPRQRRVCDSLFANPPVEVAMLWGDWHPEAPGDRVLAAGPDAARVVGLATALAGRSGTVTLLALESNQFELQLGIGQPLRLTSPVRLRRPSARSRETAVLASQKDEQAALIVVDATRQGPAEWLARGTGGELVGTRAGVPVVAVARPLPPPLRLLLQGLATLSQVLPDLSEQDRIAVYVSLRRAARGGVDFGTMVILSTAIAALGLLMDSAVIIVGAMLIAPLMTPIMSAGLGVTQGDGRVVRMSLSTVAFGAMTAVAVGGGVGLVHPHEGVTAQMAARTEPSVSDLLVAIASGAAGAYATCRTQVGSSLAGVGIAVSLVPPLAVVGLGVALGDLEVALGSSLLFLVNLSAIAATASGMFFWLGFRPRSGPTHRVAVFTRGVGTLGGVVLLILVAVLVWQDAAVSRDRLAVEKAAERAVRAVDAEATVERFVLVSHNDRLVVVDLDVRGRTITGDDVHAVQSGLARDLETPVELTLRVLPAFFAGEEELECPGPQPCRR
ncbi:MAG: DUF389 domain-containing protein [Dehalococcoidia bacterium]